jgi:hypothetical protein
MDTFRVMIGFSSDENFTGCPEMETREDDPSLKSLCAIAPEEFKARERMRLQRAVFSKSGDHMSAETLIKLKPGHALDAGKLSEVLRRSCSRYFDYLLSTSHSKTFVSELTDPEGCILGEIIVSVRPSRVAVSPPVALARVPRSPSSEGVRA